jgi:hypothetical protein
MVSFRSTRLRAYKPEAVDCLTGSTAGVPGTIELVAWACESFWVEDLHKLLIRCHAISEFVPMLWGKDTSGIKANKDKYGAAGVKAVFSFNEPDGKADNGGGSDVPPAEAAQIHADTLNGLPFEIGAPSPTQGERGSAWWTVSIACLGNACMAPTVNKRFGYCA